MTGSYPEKGAPGPESRRSPARPKTVKARGGGGNLLYLRARRPGQDARWRQDVSGAFYTLGGVCVGLVAGYVGYHYRLSDELSSLRDPVLLLLAVPALLGGGIGAFVAWLRARTRLAQALVTSEGFRQRLMSVERNQALWISLSAVLHDVRNPLHNIHLLIEGLEFPDADVNYIRQQVLEQLERINVRVRRVVAQIAEFSGDIARQPVRLGQVLGEVLEMVRPLARQSHVALTVDSGEDPLVIADPKFLVQAIDHLILNSLQILAERPGSGPRRLSVQVRRGDGGQFEVWVEDSGPGLPDEVRERLFEPLTTNRTSGMGLGLAIAHALASAAGAPLSLGHTGPEGTRFILRFQCP